MCMYSMYVIVMYILHILHMLISLYVRCVYNILKYKLHRKCYYLLFIFVHRLGVHLVLGGLLSGTKLKNKKANMSLVYEGCRMGV